MITEQQFFNASKIIGCPISCIKAVYDVEAAGRGYLPDGRVKILFEGHRFWKAVTKAGAKPANFLQGNPGYANVLYPSWDKSQYKGGAAEWDRVSMAIEVCNKLNLSPLLAFQAASYGAFQIMGENAKLCGYSDVQGMVTSYNAKGEAEQLDSFCRFIQATGLDDELRSKNWPGFAAGYNGSQYRLNNYDIKLSLADKKYTGQG